MSTTQYIGARYVPIFADPTEWNNSRTYDPLTIVMHEGNSYTSRQFVPMGIDITNDEFWVLTGNYNAQVEAYRKDCNRFYDTINALINGTVIPAVNENTENIKKVKEEADNTNVTVNNLITTVNENITYINIQSLGVKADGVTDNSARLNEIFNENNHNVYYFPAGYYGIKSTINITPSIVMAPNAYFKCLAQMDTAIKIGNANTKKEYNNQTINVNLDCNKLCDTGISGMEMAHNHINARVINFMKIGVCPDTIGGGNEENTWNIYAIAASDSTESIGIYDSGSDNIIETAICIDCKYAIKSVNTNTVYGTIHGWSYKRAITGTALIYAINTSISANMIYCDTMESVITYEGTNSIECIKLSTAWNNKFYKENTMKSLFKSVESNNKFLYINVLSPINLNYNIIPIAESLADYKKIQFICSTVTNNTASSFSDCNALYIPTQTIAEMKTNSDNMPATVTNGILENKYMHNKIIQFLYTNAKTYKRYIYTYGDTSWTEWTEA